MGASWRPRKGGAEGRRGSEERGQQVGQPAREPLPARAPLPPRLLGEAEGVVFLAVEEAVQLVRGTAIEDDGVLLIVPGEAACVEVGRAHSAESAIDHDDLGVVEARLVEPNGAALPHEPVGVVEAAVGREGDVAPDRQHDFYLDAAACSVAQGPADGAVEGEVGVDDLDAIACKADGVGVELADDAVARAGLAVDDAHHFAARRGASVGPESVEIAVKAQPAEVLRAVDALPGDPVPRAQEDGLQGVHLSALDSAVHVVPGAHLRRAVDVVVGHVHAAGVGYLAVDDYYLAVVAGKGMIDPGEAYGVERVNLDAAAADVAQVALEQRAVVAAVAESVEEGAHFHSLGRLAGQQVEEHRGDGVVAEVEVFEVHRRACLADGGKKIVEFLLPGGEQGDAVVVGKAHATRPQVAGHERVAGLGAGCRADDGKEKDEEGCEDVAAMTDRTLHAHWFSNVVA